MKDSLAHHHLLCREWKRELDFFKSEIPHFKKSLDEVASKNTSMEIMKEVEHFENKFRIIHIHIDELLHDVKLKDEALLREAYQKPNFINVKMIEQDENIEELMIDTSGDFYETKRSFYRFLARVL